jgi:hypothetical protein
MSIVQRHQLSRVEGLIGTLVPTPRKQTAQLGG